MHPIQMLECSPRVILTKETVVVTRAVGGFGVTSMMYSVKTPPRIRRTLCAGLAG